MPDQSPKLDQDKLPDETSPGSAIEPLADEDLESVAGGYCSAVACSGGKAE